MSRVFLESNKNVFSNNVESNLDIKLSTKIRLLPNNDISKEFLGKPMPSWEEIFGDLLHA